MWWLHVSWHIRKVALPKLQQRPTGNALEINSREDTSAWNTQEIKIIKQMLCYLPKTITHSSNDLENHWIKWPYIIFLSKLQKSLLLLPCSLLQIDNRKYFMTQLFTKDLKKAICLLCHINSIDLWGSFHYGPSSLSTFSTITDSSDHVIPSE